MSLTSAYTSTIFKRRDGYLSTPQRIAMFLLKALLTLLVITPLFVEAALRLTNVIYPLERPASLRDHLPMKLLEGDEWLNGVTRFYSYTPNTEGTTYGHPFHVNRWGVRGPDFLERDQVGPRPFRIMVVGDSVTGGIGIAEEDRYTNILERRLSERYPDRSIEVINVGVSGFETLQELKMLRKMWEAVGPDLTVVGVFANDTNLTYDYYLPYQMPVPERVQPLLDHFLTFRVLEAPYD